MESVILIYICKYIYKYICKYIYKYVYTIQSLFFIIEARNFAGTQILNQPFLGVGG